MSRTTNEDLTQDSPLIIERKARGPTTGAPPAVWPRIASTSRCYEMLGGRDLGARLGMVWHDGSVGTEKLIAAVRGRSFGHLAERVGEVLEPSMAGE